MRQTRQVTHSSCTNTKQVTKISGQQQGKSGDATRLRLSSPSSNKSARCYAENTINSVPPPHSRPLTTANRDSARLCPNVQRAGAVHGSRCLYRGLWRLRADFGEICQLTAHLPASRTAPTAQLDCSTQQCTSGQFLAPIRIWPDCRCAILTSLPSGTSQMSTASIRAGGCLARRAACGRAMQMLLLQGHPVLPRLHRGRRSSESGACPRTARCWGVRAEPRVPGTSCGALTLEVSKSPTARGWRAQLPTV